ncbi:hypothetical protein EVV55_28360, partial [Klebsiella pneumoniae]
SPSELAGKQADAVVRPRDEEELRQLVCACAQHHLPRFSLVQPATHRANWRGNRRTRWFARAMKRSCASWSAPARST